MKVRRRDTRIWFVGLGVFVMVFLFTFFNGHFESDKRDVDAASVENFDPGYIISDYQMGNYNSMSESEIQAFLTEKNSCSNRDVNLYNSMVASYPSYSWHFKDGHFVCLSEELFGDGEVIGSGETAAHIIWQAAQDYKINPQVLIVLLQKEQGLITDTYPHNRQYRAATGYGCPDTAPCAEEYYGFKNQVRKAAALFRTVLDGGWTNYPLGENYIQYNPSSECGGSVVNIRSLATSALYRYTPYQPNAGALAAGYGTAYCGAYGNRNFYLYFEDWFGGITTSNGANNIVTNGIFAWINMVSPRAMKINRETMMVNPVTKEIYENGATQIGDVYFFDSKIDLVWNNKNEVCLRTATDTEDKINRCIIMSRMEEVDNYYDVEQISQVKLIIKNDTKKINLKTGKNVQDVPVEMYGEIVFVGKTVFNGKTYFQTKYDYEHNNEFFIPEDDLGNVKFIDFMYPRNLETNKSVVFYNLYTGEICKEVKGGYVKRYVTKTTVGESNYYQTEDDLGGNCAILSTDVSEINGAMDFSGLEFKDFMLPRELRIKVSTYSINVLDGTSCDVFYEKDETMMFTTKIQDYYRNEKDTKANIKCVIPSWKLAEINEF